MKLFGKVFLSFWLATLLMDVVVLSVSRFVPVSVTDLHERAFTPEVATAALTAALNSFEDQGQKSFNAHVAEVNTLQHTDVTVFDGNGRAVVAGDQKGVIFAPLARDVAQSGNITLVHSAFHMVYARPLTSNHGRHYIVVIAPHQPSRPLRNPRFWFYMAIAMLPAAGVCALLTFYITGPITKLRSASRLLAQGNLASRAQPSGQGRKDELGDLERDFDAMASQIESLMTAQRRFVTDVSHELGGPITRLYLALSLLRRDFVQGRYGALVRIEREIDSLSRLVQQLLFLAGLEAGRIPDEARVLSQMRPFCRSLLEDAEFEATHAQCTLKSEVEDVSLLIYPELFRRAIENVLRNALRHAPPASEVELVCRVDTMSERLLIEVSDRGPGVPEEMLDKIFAPFFRTALGREVVTGGAGLGLSIASEAVHLHQGSITARNRDGGGLVVSIAILLKQPTSTVDRS